MTVTIDFMLVILAIGLSLVAVRTSYYILAFFAGVAWWGLAAYWMHDPIVGGDPVDNIMLVFAIFAGVAMMFKMGWKTKMVDGREVGSFAIRLPSVFGGQSEEDEVEATNSRDWHIRRSKYQERLNGRSR